MAALEAEPPAEFNNRQAPYPGVRAPTLGIQDSLGDTKAGRAGQGCFNIGLVPETVIHAHVFAFTCHKADRAQALCGGSQVGRSCCDHRV